jgi:hypothetical protein
MNDAWTPNMASTPTHRHTHWQAIKRTDRRPASRRYHWSIRALRARIITPTVGGKGAACASRWVQPSIRAHIEWPIEAAHASRSCRFHERSGEAREGASEFAQGARNRIQTDYSGGAAS